MTGLSRGYKVRGQGEIGKRIFYIHGFGAPSVMSHKHFSEREGAKGGEP